MLPSRSFLKSNGEDMSILVRMLPYYEQARSSTRTIARLTTQQTQRTSPFSGWGSATLICPDDPNAQTSYNLTAVVSLGNSILSWNGIPTPPGTWYMRSSSYWGSPARLI